MRMPPKFISARSTKLSILSFVLLGSIFFLSPRSFAKISATLDDSALEQYYTIEEQQSVRPATVEDSKTAALESLSLEPFSFRTLAAQAQQVALSLLHWTLHSDSPPLPRENYNRRSHFGRWINDPTDDSCFNTRAKVLLRDTEGPISYRENNHCVVDKGTWNDAYTGRKFIESRDIQIDHMVPLKDAYDSGAWEWDFQTRCLYANFMGNTFHLISSNGIENMRKGDRAPDEYLPPNLSYRCEYIENWLKVKLIWKLKMTPSEVAAIRQNVKDNGCKPDSFSLTDSELRKQRRYIQSNLGLCPAR